MKMRRPKRLFFQVFGVALVIGAILLGCYQVQWIRTALRAEERRIINDIRRSAERALDEAFDEIRVLFSFAYISPENIAEERLEEVSDSLGVWKNQSNYPGLLENVFIIPTPPNEQYFVYTEESGKFTEIQTPQEFLSFTERLVREDPVEAYRRSHPALLQEGYFVFPLSRFEAGAESGSSAPLRFASAFLAIQVDVELLYTEMLPAYLGTHLDRYTYKIAGRERVYFSSSPGPDIKRTPDVIVPVFGDFFPKTNASSPEERNDDASVAERAMRNPIARFWFLRTSGFPNSYHSTPQEVRARIPTVEIFHPDRTLESATRNRILSSVLLSIGTLLILLTSYFVLYMLLTRADKLRNRERDFVTSMSHELRTPVSVINATSDNLSRGIVANPEKVKNYGGLIQAQSQRLGKMVESILFYSGMESMDTDSLTGNVVHLESFFQEIIGSLTPTAEEAEANVRLLLETRIEAVRSDPEALRIIAENLIMNAFHHGTSGTSGDEVRVIIRTRPPRLLYLVVEDGGPGIPQTELKQIFEPFSRGERSKAEQISGSGLGLHIVRRVCIKLGGQVTVESPYADMAGIFKRGTRFTVKIPVRYEGERSE